ncbi:MAG: UDP-N-acetylglucosamine--N-acetylmuramyl-(pentapeptide) pyrophosphoryl-undecaprenol [Thermoproteota archaeon]|nr:UDP-N-acetylglucosamine--N-acetylmuramyl-(pentapeptide) pyrophosphoryl-undecaprenol [Thermoproteota archaeon]
MYFGVCGIGLGHVGRCIPIANSLRQAGNEVAFSTYKEAISYVKRENYHLFRAPPIYFAVKSDGGVDFRLTTAKPGIFSIFIFLNQLKKEIEFLKRYSPDFVVSDSRLSTIIAAFLLKIPALTILNLYRITIPREKRFLHLAKIADGGILTIIGRIWNMSKAVLVPDFPYPYTLSVENLLVPPWRRKKIKLIGPTIPTRAEDLPEAAEIRRSFGLDDRPLIFVPISGPPEERRYFTDLMKQLLRNFSNDYQIIMSLGSPSSQTEPIRSGSMITYDWLPNRFEVLKACDLVISRAGLGTITQAICYGKPLLLIPTPHQTEQLNNAKRAEKLGVAMILDQKALNCDLLLSAVKKFFSLDSYKIKAEEIQREVSRYDAVNTTVKMIKDLSG